ncbi:methyltransferase domain-containing protein [Primorskyibacter aestuariivivens]|uniref:tRNA1(Val) (adenine(37)-N6)-methyltransferase n=1 Tax=Primorskyibacter aestuariivivens TaxID=1888912 RepID=UPI0023019385|nr:methyltransferase domain-containing protein [Primorskyibacter aestuariivivens]MDA7428245.1 methyltransferase domain-containing protein [Primorskyibacter aestuariivivens]
MTSNLKTETTDNAFLGGRLQILQPAQGYRAGVDPVFLAASIPARPGQEVLELGCGVGTALFCLGARVAGLELHGVELQPEYAALARENARRNGMAAEITDADISCLPPALRGRSFDHVIANPPYFDRDTGHASPDGPRETGRGEALPLGDWVQVAAKRLRPGGHASFIQRIERLPELLQGMSAHLGSVEVLPLAPRVGRGAKLVLIRGRKGGGAAFRLHAPLILHRGTRHERDGDDYTPLISKVLRNGAALPFEQAQTEG